MTAMDTIEQLRTGRRWGSWQPTRWQPLMLVLVLVSMAATLASLPINTSEHRLYESLRQGEVRYVQLGTPGTLPERRLSDGLFPSSRPAEHPTGRVRWVDSRHVYHQTDLPLPQPLTEAADTGVDTEFRDDPDTAGPALKYARDTVTGVAAKAGWPIADDAILYDLDSTFRDRLAQLPPLVWVLLVIVLILGPQPYRFTKWGVFWLLSIPLQLGALWWVLKEAPWNASAVRAQQAAAEGQAGGAQADGAPPHRCRGGWTGLGYSVLIGTIVLFVGSMLASLLTGA